MSENWILLILLIIVLGFCAIYSMICYYIDKRRILTSANEKDWREVTVTWTPIVFGIYLDQRTIRNYRVTFKDPEGNRYMKYCTVSTLAGIYWRDEN